MLNSPLQPTVFPHLIRLDFNATDAILLARQLRRQADQTYPGLLIDCGYLPCLHTRGIGYFASQLLLLHGAGASIVLCNVDPLLYRVLRLLRLDAVFQIECPRAR